MTATFTKITDNAARYLTGEINATLTLDSYVEGFADDYDMESVNAEYRTACADVLDAFCPEWRLVGNLILAPVGNNEPLGFNELDAMRECIAEISRPNILARHAYRRFAFFADDAASTTLGAEANTLAGALEEFQQLTKGSLVTRVDTDKSEREIVATFRVVTDSPELEEPEVTFWHIVEM